MAGGHQQRRPLEADITLIVDEHTMGRTIRNANRRQRRALQAIYRCCAFAGCDVVFERCEIHHIRPWELGGLTDLSNLIPLCSRHHHVVHEDGWRLELADDRTLTITRPNGQPFATTKADRQPDRQPDRHTTRRQPAA